MSTGGTTPTLRVQRYRTQMRGGQLTLGDRTLTFGLIGGSGNYLGAVYDGWPTFYLMGRNGVILVRRTDNEDFLAQLDQFLAQ